MRVGFIGLGYMGKPMAENIARAGFDPTVYDIRKEVVEDLEKLGAVGAGSSKEVAASSECVITMVLNDAQTEEVVLGQKGVLEGIREGVLIVMSTASPSLVRRISEIFMKEKGFPVYTKIRGAIQDISNPRLKLDPLLRLTTDH
jgi:2-hydroxy-3-oxopropionate reductase